MAQQINLYDPTLKRTREWLTLGNLLVLGVGLALVVFVHAVAARLELPVLAKRVADSEAQTKALREQFARLGQTLAERQPDAALVEAIAQQRQRLEQRRAVHEALAERRAGKAGEPYAELLRGLARQSMNGLWLTGFSVDAHGRMEIRGRTLDPALLPEYIRRLNREAAFQGRAFAALKLEPGKAEPPAGTMPSPAPTPASTLSQRAPWHEFTLIPLKAEGEAPARSGAGGTG
ncbi:MAG: PilN domain-containing protein [Rhodocyclaceae bacterium]|nr:PilN domain-containing protein [Rhodocyclaceae bacterium]